MSEYPMPEERYGWPPGVRCEWQGWRWVMFLAQGDELDLEALGPPGTIWTFTQEDALQHCEGGLLSSALRWVARVPLINGVGHWVVPQTWETTMDWLRATVVANLPGGEQMNHTLQFVHPDESDLPQDAAGLTEFATDVAAQWVTFLNQPAGGNASIRNVFHNGVTFDHVQAQHLRQVQPYVSGGNNAGKTTQVGPTVVSAPMAVQGAAGGNRALPHQVALALTLRTRAPQAGGVSHGRRNRGRLYLGGLAINMLQDDTSGLFANATVDDIATRFGTHFIAPLYADGWQLTIISKVGLIGHQVTNVSAGRVPDTQRRRRRSLEEDRTTAWSIP